MLVYSFLGELFTHSRWGFKNLKDELSVLETVFIYQSVLFG